MRFGAGDGVDAWVAPSLVVVPHRREFGKEELGLEIPWGFKIVRFGRKTFLGQSYLTSDQRFNESDGKLENLESKNGFGNG